MAMPDPESVHVNVTVTVVLFQPAAFGVGDTVVVTVGAVVSMDTVRDADAELPATSTAEREITWLVPSVDTTTGRGHVAIPERVSAHVNVTVTGAVYQPATSGGRSAVAAITGGVASTL